MIQNVRSSGTWRILVFVSVLFISFGLFAAHSSAMTAEGKIIVVLDPGHAEGDGGGTSLGTYPEYWYNMQVAEACRSSLISTGRFEVYLTHEDTSTPMSAVERTLVADRVNADILISIHFDGSFDSSQNGVETFVSVLPEYRMYDLGYRLLHNLSSRTGMSATDVYMREDSGDGKHVYFWDYDRSWDVPDDRTAGPLSDYYGIITWPAKFGIPAIIIEHGFLSNPHDRAFADDPANLALLGQIDAQTVFSYYFGHSHDFSEERCMDYPSNCCFTGKESYRCSICKCRKDTETLPADPENHWYLPSVHVDSTCSDPGYDECICRYTDNLRSRDYPVEQHTERRYLPLQEHKGILKTEAESFSVICSECGALMFGPVETEGHTYRLTSCMMPDCGNPGVVRVRCADCGFDKIMTVPPTGLHTYVTVSESLPTCTQDGIRITKCTGCGRTLSEDLPATGHAFTCTEESPATCERAGYRVYLCENCMLTKTEELSALGHRYVTNGVWIEKPTLFSVGVRELVCENDPGHKSSEIVPRLRFTEWIIRPDGYLTSASVGAAFLLAVLTIFLFKRNTRNMNPAGAEDPDENAVTDPDPSVPDKSEECSEESPSETGSTDKDQSNCPDAGLGADMTDVNPEETVSETRNAHFGHRRARRNPNDNTGI